MSAPTPATLANSFRPIPAPAPMVAKPTRTPAQVEPVRFDAARRRMLRARAFARVERQLLGAFRAPWFVLHALSIRAASGARPLTGHAVSDIVDNYLEKEN